MSLRAVWQPKQVCSQLPSVLHDASTSGAPRRYLQAWFCASFGILKDVTPRRVAIIRCRPAACGTMSSGDFTDSVNLLQSFFEPWDESQTSMDLPSRVSKAAQNGDVHTVRRWLAAGGSPDASRIHSPGLTASLLEYACASSRPANTEIVGLLCAAGANIEGSRGDGEPIYLASRYRCREGVAETRGVT